MFHIYTATLIEVESAEVSVFPPGKICRLGALVTRILF